MREGRASRKRRPLLGRPEAVNRYLPGRPKGSRDLDRCKATKVVMLMLKESQAILLTQVLLQVVVGVR